jgi:hypothetical protein
MTAVEAHEMTGGSPITSYSLEWDSGNGNVFAPVLGFDENNIVLEYTFDSLTKGSTYKFRYRVKNIYGWSPYSSETEQLAAKTADKPSAPQTSNTQTSATI